MTRDYPYILASWITIIFPVLFLIGGVIPEIAMDIIGGLFLLHSVIVKDWKWCREKWVQCLGILWVCMIARSLLTPAEHLVDSFSHSIVFARYFIFSAALAYWVFTDRAVQGNFMKVLTAVLLFMMCDGLFQYYRGFDVLGFPSFESLSGSARLSSTFRKPILGIMTTWLAFPMFMKFLSADKEFSLKSKNSLIAVFLSFLVLAVVSLSGERMALLLMLFGWAMAVLLMPKYRKRVIIMLVVGCVAVGATAVMFPQVLKRQEGSTVQTLTSWWDSPYGMLLKTDLRMAAINPVFGIGPDQFRFDCPSLYPGKDEVDLKAVCNIHPHNMYMEWLIGDGVIGLSLFLIFLGLVLCQCVKHWPQAKNEPLFIGFLIAFTLRIWPIASTTGLFSRWGASPLWLVFGCMMACMLMHKKEEA
jgi:O-antigen ligase